MREARPQGDGRTWSTQSVDPYKYGAPQRPFQQELPKKQYIVDLDGETAQLLDKIVNSEDMNVNEWIATQVENYDFCDDDEEEEES